jgi:flagellar hook-basal body complex protein FliE
MSVVAVSPIAFEAFGALTGLGGGGAGAAAAPAPGAFASLLTGGVADVETKVAEADKLARAFVLDDSVPVHQVTYALEEARMSLELMLQVRARIVESYQQLMTMQL